MSESYWRKHAAPIIAEVLERTKGKDEKTIRKELRDAYPFGSFDHHPYKIWRDEIACQRGLKPEKPKLARPTLPPDPRQSEMF